MTRAAPAWLPNWREPKNYPTTLTLAEWRWQFLRRRPDYQRDFARLPDTVARPVSFLIRRNKKWLKKPIAATTKDTTAPLLNKYGRTYLLDPASPHAPVDYFPSPAGFNVHADHEQIERWYAMGYEVCRIDLAEPLEAQFKSLKKVLAAKAKSKGLARRREAKYWPKYLCVLDGHAAGATLDTITGIVHDDKFAPPAAAGNWLKSARELQLSLTGGSP